MASKGEKMSKRFVYDYYTVAVPGDLADDINALADQAIAEAQERSKLYFYPCIWTAEHISGEVGDYEVTFRVCRKRNKSQSIPF